MRRYDTAGMCQLASCLLRGQGVTEDPAQAAVWMQKAADLGDAGAKATLGAMLVHGDVPAGAGGLQRIFTRPTSNRRAESARLYEHSPVHTKVLSYPDLRRVLVLNDPSVR